MCQLSARREPVGRQLDSGFDDALRAPDVVLHDSKLPVASKPFLLDDIVGLVRGALGNRVFPQRGGKLRTA